MILVFFSVNARIAVVDQSDRVVNGSAVSMDAKTEISYCRLHAVDGAGLEPSD